MVKFLLLKQKAYRNFLNQRAIPDYESVKGNTGVYILEQPEEEIIHFITLSFWQNEDIEVAKYYDEERDFLLEFEPKVWHYEVVGQL